MVLSPTRRTGLAALAAFVLVPVTACGPSGSGTAPEAEASAASHATEASAGLAREFERLEKEFDARLGVYAVDTGTEEEVVHRPDERFAYCSTHKAFSAGAVLQRNTPEEMEEVITYTEDDLLDYAPITEQHVDTGMTLMELTDAAVRYSDNTAANLLFEELDGPDGFEEAMEAVGDDVIEADRVEPGLNEAVPGDIRDTSTPRAMAESLRKFTLGDALPEDRRDVLTDMLVNNMTGDELIRAGVPEGWEVGDKTGSGGYGTRNDIAVLWPPEGEPIVLAVMSSRDEEDAEYDNALIAEAAEVVVEALA
ncbi:MULTISPECIES: class A beta-lactamase [Nocardiopsis]|uniref:Beta-lactamase n=1 Tax=Nocardiopsis sinuspersici TaxID=501010 RepID=A0A1V3BZI0_9ACTN|nr:MULTISPECIES: class A beta-lactamase [Nocardiopsis]NYH54911.1 beta-lactamase class A [Nocardiopsis sinuspersici]OOC53656.1 class A beta-lactamase [Nocardiopsis sinuspersici]